MVGLTLPPDVYKSRAVNFEQQRLSEMECNFARIAPFQTFEIRKFDGN